MISEEYRKRAGLTPGQIVDTMERFYVRVDEACGRVTRALEKNGRVLSCRAGCSGCCLDGLSVTRAEAAVIGTRHADVLRQAPNDKGGCAFLDADGLCRVYASRPYICRTHGLPLRWLDEDETGAEAEMRDICDLNAHIDPAALGPEECWTLGVPELQLQKMNEITFGDCERIDLRSLFAGG